MRNCINLCLLSLLVINIQATALAFSTATITVKTIPTELFANEPFNLIFQTVDTVDGSPDFTPLEKNYTITKITQRNDFKVFTGDFARSDNWIVELIADKTGRQTIPAIAFGKDRSQVITLDIKPQKAAHNPANRDFISELDVSSKNVFERSQVIVTQRMLSTRKTARPSFSDLKISGVNVIQEKLGEGTAFTIKRGEKTFHVLEINTAIYPQETGQMFISASVAVAQVAADGDANINPFMGNSVTKSALSTALEITIKPMPDSFNETNWLPAKQVRLEEEWSGADTTFNVGEPVTRHLSLFVDGQGYTQLPKLPVTPIKNIKHYPDKPMSRNRLSAEGISSTVTTRVVLIPTQPGTYTLPAIEIPWWNTQKNERALATIPARVIEIKGPATTATSTDASSTPSINNASNNQAQPQTNHSKIYLWVSIFLGMGWMSTLLLWADINRSRKKRHPTETQPAPETTDLYHAGKNLKTACDSGEALACERALIIWGKIIFNDMNITNLGALAQRCDEVLATEIRKLETALYSSDEAHWNAEVIWKSSLEVDHTRQKSIALNDLEPMYR